MTAVYLVIFGTVALLGLTVVILFGWAIKSGQLQDFQRGATSIFDADEPEGEPTDRFPDQDAKHLDGDSDSQLGR